MKYVYVLDMNGQPLMPTIRYGHVRRLLNSKKAIVVNLRPFTIKLLYEPKTHILQDVTLGPDPGRENIGLSCTNDKGDCLFSSKTITINKLIPKRMRDRKTSRQMRRMMARQKKRRRAVKYNTVKPGIKDGVFERILPGCDEPLICHDIKNSEARFNNRKRKKGWLTPTARHLLLTHLNLIKLIRKILPVTDISLELNKFSFVKMENPEAAGIDFQNGPLKGFDDVNDAVDEFQHHKCIMCGGKIAHHHHLVPRSKGGSDTIENIAGLCNECHDKVHKDKAVMKSLKAIKKGVNKKYAHLSVLNQIIPYLYKALEDDKTIKLHITDGYETAFMRKALKLEKDHDIDAYLIACNGKGIEPKLQKFDSYTIKQFRNHDRQAIHANNYDRNYMLDGKKVASNRHKSSTQQTDSLEEFRKTHTKQEMSKLTIKPHKPQYRQKQEYMPGSLFIHNNKLFVLDKYEGAHLNKEGIRQSDYCYDTEGNKHPFRQCHFVQHSEGLRYI